MSTDAVDTQPSSLVAEQAAEISDRLPADDGGQSGNLEKIRDILFGQQARDHERRFTLLEQSLAKEASALRTELNKRFDALEAYMQQEVAVLSGRLQHEQQARGEALQQLVADLTGLGTVVEKRSTELAQQTLQTEHTLRQEALAHMNELKEDLRATQTQLTDSLDRSVRDLRHTKTDRTALAELLAELSKKLHDGTHPS